MSFTVEVQRRSGNTFSPLEPLGKIGNREPVRLFAQDALPGVVRFRIYDIHRGTYTFDSRAQVTLAGPQGGQAWLDVAGPDADGLYRLEGTNEPTVGKVWAAPFQMFFVTANAPPPPSEPPKTGILGGVNIPNVIGDVKGIGWLVVIGLGLAMVGKVLPGRKKE